MPGWEPSSEPTLTITGRWESDGSAEHLVVTQDGIKPGPGNLVNAFPFECLYDESFFAYHRFDERKYFLEARRIQRTFLDLYGPFEWWHKPFPFILKSEFGNARVTRRASTLSGRRLETEIYRQEEEGATVQLLIHYDPALGYLPRYIRGWSYPHNPALNKSNVKEFYLVSASPCAAGGFIPTEWVDTFFAVRNFDPNSPDYSDDMPLKAAGRVSLSHFKLVELRNQKGEVGMDQLQEVKLLGSFGGVVKLPPGTARLTLGQIEKFLGKRIDSLRKSDLPIPPTAPKAKSTAPTLCIAAMFFASVVASAWAFRRSIALHSIILALSLVVGCTPSQTSTPQLGASFAQPSVLYEPGLDRIDLTLNVVNRWNHPLKIVGADGGCSCRRLDQTGLPFVLPPGGSHGLRIWYKPQGALEPSHVGFLFSTDVGNIACRASIQALPRHSVSPDSLTLSSIPDNEGDQQFELVHREITEVSSDCEAAELVPSDPAGFASSVVGVHEDSLGDDGRYKFRDTTYHVSLIDRALGSHRAELRLRARRTARALLSVPVVWQRVPFVSSIPDRVVLGTRPIRVFLRCSDESVELTRVVSSPRGVKAVLSSPRELVVQPTNKAPDVLDGVIVVGTTAADRPSIDIPLVRYQPTQTPSQARPAGSE